MSFLWSLENTDRHYSITKLNFVAKNHERESFVRSQKEVEIDYHDQETPFWPEPLTMNLEILTYFDPDM
jgi:hypothetical protein